MSSTMAGIVTSTERSYWITTQKNSLGNNWQAATLSTKGETMSQISLLQEILTIFAQDHPTAELRSYSGRGMNGKQCLAVVIRSWDLGLLVGELIAYAVAEAEHVDPRRLNELYKQVKSLQADSMGHGMVVYFPSVELVAPAAHNADEPESVVEVSRGFRLHG